MASDPIWNGSSMTVEFNTAGAERHDASMATTASWLLHEMWLQTGRTMGKTKRIPARWRKVILLIRPSCASAGFLFCIRTPDGAVAAHAESQRWKYASRLPGHEYHTKLQKRPSTTHSARWRPPSSSCRKLECGWTCTFSRHLHLSLISPLPDLC